MALLPMKGNSVRVPGKNLKDFAGEPLFFRVAETLQSCDFVNSIIINTDSNEIAEKAKQNFSKVRIHQRPEALYGDDVPMNSIIADDLKRSDGNIYLQTHSTNPLLSVQTLSSAWSKFNEQLLEGMDSLFGVTTLKTRLYDHELKPINHDPAKLIKTQDLLPIYEENSNFYFFTRSSFERAGRRIGDRFSICEVNKTESLDIDDDEDFKIAEFIYKHKKEQG